MPRNPLCSTLPYSTAMLCFIPLLCRSPLLHLSAILRLTSPLCSALPLCYLLPYSAAPLCLTPAAMLRLTHLPCSAYPAAILRLAYLSCFASSPPPYSALLIYPALSLPSAMLRLPCRYAPPLLSAVSYSCLTPAAMLRLSALLYSASPFYYTVSCSAAFYFVPGISSNISLIGIQMSFTSSDLPALRIVSAHFFIAGYAARNI